MNDKNGESCISLVFSPPTIGNGAFLDYFNIIKTAKLGTIKQ